MFLIKALIIIYILVIFLMIIRRFYVRHVIPNTLMGTDYLMAKRNNFKPHYCYSTFNFFNLSDKEFNEKYIELKTGIENQINDNGIICENFDYKKLEYYKLKRHIDEFIELKSIDNMYDFFDDVNVNKERSFVVFVDKKNKRFTYFWDHTVFDGMRFYHVLTTINPELYKRYDKNVYYVPVLSEIFLLNTLVKKLIWPLKSSITVTKMHEKPPVNNMINMKHIKKIKTNFKNIKTISIIVGVYVKHIFNNLKTNRKSLNLAILYGFIDKRFRNNTSAILIEVNNGTLENIISQIDSIIKKSIIDVNSIAYFKNYFGFIKLENKYKTNKIDIFFTQFYTVQDFASNHLYLTCGSDRPELPFFCHCYTSNKLVNYCTTYNTEEINVKTFSKLDMNHI